MSYTIKSKRAVGETLFTTVEFTLADKSKVEVEIPHFQPESKEDIIRGIENRELSEQRSYDAAIKVKELLTTL